MSLQRSPPGRSGSLTDLRKTNEAAVESQITYRKRKQPDSNCNCSQEIQDFRKEITSLLTKFTSTQEETLKFMRENLTEVNSKLNEIKNSTDVLNNEQQIMKSQLSGLIEKAKSSETKIHALESDIAKIKNTEPNIATSENIIQEMKERTIRERNIIIVGVRECKEANTNEAQLYDENEVVSITKSLVNSCPKPAKVFRIGKYNPLKSRSIKVCFESPQTVKLLLRNKNQLRKEIKIFSDQTPAQQNYLKTLQEELGRRTANQESDITIKYIRGVPKIVKNSPKNDKKYQTTNA